MPIKRLKGGAFQFGNHGKIYRGKDAKKKAQAQAAAIHASGWKE